MDDAYKSYMSNNYSSARLAKEAVSIVANRAKLAKEILAERGITFPSDSEVMGVINQLAIAAFGASLVSDMEQVFLTKFKGYIAREMLPDQAFEKIEDEFKRAAERQDAIYIESRTGIKLLKPVPAPPPPPAAAATVAPTPPASVPAPTVTPAAPVQKTAGASGGNNNLLIYGGIAAVGLFLLFGNKKKGLSGTRKKKAVAKKRPVRRKTTKKR